MDLVMLGIRCGRRVRVELLFQDHLGVECLEQEYRFEEEEEEEQLQQHQQEQQAQFSIPSLEDRMPFLQMLQSVETPPFFPFKEPNFQTLLKLQHLKRPPIWDIDTTTTFVSETDHQPQQTQALELESCVTHDSSTADLLHSPVKCETKDLNQITPHSNLSPEPNNNQPQPNPTCKRRNSLARNLPQSMPNETHFSKPSPAITRERRKRKRTRTAKNKEEVESQRVTHIAVERNRRRQMNDYLTCLRSIMPSSYVQRGDQASIIGGAIDFVKELEQLLQSLEAQKRMRNSGEEMGICTDGLFTSQCNDNNDIVSVSEDGNCELGEEGKAKRKSDAAELEVTTIQNHVNLKIQCQRRHGQLLRAIVALEDLRLTVLHLNITSSQSMVLYSFNLKMEEDCKLRSTDEVAAAVHQIFSIINNSC